MRARATRFRWHNSAPLEAEVDRPEAAACACLDDQRTELECITLDLHLTRLCAMNSKIRGTPSAPDIPAVSRMRPVALVGCDFDPSLRELLWRVEGGLRVAAAQSLPGVPFEVRVRGRNR